MMDKKRIANFRTRINKAKMSLNIGTDMFLSFDIDGMDLADKITLQRGLLNSRAPLSYKYLDASISKDMAKLDALQLDNLNRHLAGKLIGE